MEIEIVKFFQNMASSFLDVFFLLITKLGEETFFLIIFTCIYLCYDKIFAVKYSVYYLISVGINSLVKYFVKRPRPHIVSNEVINRLPASNYSFPSGHSQGYFIQSTVGMNEIHAKCNKSKFKVLLLVGLIIIGILVMISRLYWGQHFLSDVIVGMMFGLSIPFVLDGILNYIPTSFKKKFTQDRCFLAIGILATIISVILFVVEFSIGFYSRTVYKFSGVMLSISLGYFLENKYIGFDPKQGWIWGFFKFIIALVLLFGLYWILGLFIPLQSFGYFVVYFILGFVATFVLPAIFKLLSLKK